MYILCKKIMKMMKEILKIMHKTVDVRGVLLYNYA